MIRSQQGLKLGASRKREGALYLHAPLTNAAAASEAGQAEASADPVQPAFVAVANCAQPMGGSYRTPKGAQAYQAGMVADAPKPKDARQSHFLQHHPNLCCNRSCSRMSLCLDMQDRAVICMVTCLSDGTSLAVSVAAKHMTTSYLVQQGI